MALPHDMAEQRPILIVVTGHVFLSVDDHVATVYLLIGEVPVLGLITRQRALALKVDPRVTLPAEIREISACHI